MSDDEVNAKMLEYTTTRLEIIAAMIFSRHTGEKRKEIGDFEIVTQNYLVAAKTEKPEGDLLSAILADDALRAVYNTQLTIAGLMSSARRRV